MKPFDTDDYTALRKKFEQAAPELPDELRAKRIKEKINVNQNHKTVQVRMPVRWQAAIRTACIVAALGALFGLLTQTPFWNTDANNIGIIQSEEELAAKINSLQKQNAPNELGSNAIVQTPSEQLTEERTQPRSIQTDGNIFTMLTALWKTKQPKIGSTFFP